MVKELIHNEDSSIYYRDLESRCLEIVPRERVFPLFVVPD